jgi:hypothetical protein
VIPGVLAAQPSDDLPPGEGAEVAEGDGRDPGSEVGGPTPQYRVEPEQQGFERQVRVLSAPGLHLRGRGLDGLGRGVGVDVAAVGASLAAALDVPSEEVEALVDVGDQGLLRGQAQTHRGQDPGDLLAEGFGVVLGARDEQAPVIGVPHQAVVGPIMTAPGEPLVAADARASRRMGDVLVQHRQGHVAQQRREHAPNAMGNFEFDVTLSYRRLERPRRVANEA